MSVTIKPIREPAWLTRVHIIAILSCGLLAAAGLVIFRTRDSERTPAMWHLVLAAGGLFLLMILVRKLVRRGATAHANVLMHFGFFIFSCIFAVYDVTSYRILLFVPWVAIAMSHIHLHEPRSQFLPTIVWCAISLSLVFLEKLEVVPMRPWIAGIGWVNMFVNAIGVMFSLSWRYNTSVNQLGYVTHVNTTLQADKADLQAQVEANIADLAEREERFRTVSELTSDYAFGWTITRDQRIISNWSTDAIVTVTGYTREEFESNWQSVVHPDDHEIYRRRLRNILNNETDESYFRILYRGTGDVRWLHAKTRPIWSEAEKRVVGAVGAIVDVTERREREDYIEQLAYYDPLTHFGNRRQWQFWTNGSLAEGAIKGAKAKFCIMYIDLDRFKAVNDTLGHDVGDGLLLEVSERMFSCLGPDDRLARLGGDEFGILLRNGADEARALSVARNVLNQFDAPFIVRGHTIQSRCSIGIACYPRDGSTIRELQQNAEIAMYRAKTRTEHVQVYSPQISTYMDEQVQLEAELGAAIERDELSLQFQPIMDLRSGVIAKAESLMRWNNPRRGAVSPGIFIPLAEESGMIVSMDRWAAYTAFEQVAGWLRQGVTASLSVNLSVLSLRDGEFIDFVREALRRSGVPAEHITFEITESAAIEDPEATSRVLHTLRHMGFKIAIDDFGSGYTSIVFLKNLPVDYVKIDKSFVDGIGADTKDEGVLRAVIALAKGLDIETVAEGVEHEHQMEWLSAHGCDFVQGWFVGKAVSAADFVARCTAPVQRTTFVRR